MKRFFGRPTTIDDIIETTILMLSENVFLNEYAGIKYSDGTPAKIIKYRNYSGVEVKQQKLTMSVYPYHYEGTSKPTPESPNASVVFKPYGLMGPDPTRPENGIDIAVANIKIDLAMLAYTLVASQTPATLSTITSTPGLFGTTIPLIQQESMDGERILRQWMEYIRVVLTSDMFNLNGLVKSSTVHWINFPSTQWDDKNGSLILHRAEMIWQVEYYPLREWKPEAINRLKDPLIGSLQVDGSPVFYRPDVDLLITGFGVILLETPGGIPLTWDVLTQQFIQKITRAPLSNAALIDPSTGDPFINTNLLPIGVITSGDIPLYYNKTTTQIMRYDGTIFNLIPGPNASLNIPEGTLNITDTSKWLSIAWDPINNYLVYGTQVSPDPTRIQGQPVVVTDMIDPSTQDLYLVTGQAFGLNFEVRPSFREFLVFNPNK